jgi:hypothetical protein
LFIEKPGPKDIWLKYFGTAGKPGGKQRKQTSPCIFVETCLLDSILIFYPVARFMRLGIKGQAEDGWYPISKVTVMK